MFWCLLIREAKIPLFVFTAVGNSADLRDLRVMLMAVVVVVEVHELQKVLWSRGPTRKLAIDVTTWTWAVSAELMWTNKHTLNILNANASKPQWKLPEFTSLAHRENCSLIIQINTLTWKNCNIILICRTQVDAKDSCQYDLIKLFGAYSSAAKILFHRTQL